MIKLTRSTLLSQRESAQGALALVLVSLSSGKAIKYMSLGVGSSAAVAVSKQAIVVVSRASCT